MRTGRPREGNARRVTLSVKVTEQERDELIRRHGSAYMGLRKAVDLLLLGVAGRVRTEPTASAKGGNPNAGVTVNMGDGSEDVAVTMHGGGGGGGNVVTIPEDINVTVAADRGASRNIDTFYVNPIADEAPDDDILTGETFATAVGQRRVVTTKPRHVHKPNTLIEHDFEAGVKYETWACECGHVLPRRKAK